jgi:hypothetical protein
MEERGKRQAQSLVNQSREVTIGDVQPPRHEREAYRLISKCGDGTNGKTETLASR